MTGGFGAALISFIAATSVMVALMFTLSLAIATAQEGLVATLRAHVIQVKKYGGAVLIGVGLWLIALTAFAGYFAHLFPV